MTNQQTITLTINGQEIQTVPGRTILEVARERGIDIPALCYDPRLEPYGSCLMCVVEVEGMPKLLLSCATEVRAGMIIRTENERIAAARKTALDMLLSNHFADCRGNCYDRCPADVDVQGYIAFTAMGKYQEALELIRASNPLPLVCGRVCVRYCEAGCRRAQADSAVGINFMKRYVADLEHDRLPVPVPPPTNGRKVAVVGGGPAGLTAAYFLARGGTKVTIFDMMPHLGGMIRWGIPDYRLPRATLDKEIEYILGFGVEARYNQKLGRDFTLETLKKEGFEAIFLALGSWKAKSMRVKNEETEGVWGGIDFLRRVKLEGPPVLAGPVLVVGGGNTAIDAARTALRCQASKVTILYRRTRDEMPADSVEIEDALAEGVEIKFLTAPLEVVVTDGRATGMRCQQMELGEPDASGRRRPVPVEGSNFVVPGTTIIAAIGQDSDLTCLNQDPIGNLERSKYDTIVIQEPTFATNLPGVFAGGDVATGPKAAIDAIGAGRKVASVIARYLETGVVSPLPGEFFSKTENLGPIPESVFAAIQKTERAHMRQTDAQSRIQTFEEVDHGIPEASIPRETERCLSCGCSSVFDCDLKALATKYHADQKRFAGKFRRFEVDVRHPFVKLDANKCIQCGKCVRLCGEVIGASALGFVHRGYETIVKPALDRALQDTPCISCGNCIDICPTGAIDFHLPFNRPGPWKTTAHESVCQFCGTGCGVVFQQIADNAFTVSGKPLANGAPGNLCFRGRFGHDFLADPGRLRIPLVRTGAGLRETDWKSAWSTAWTSLDRVRQIHGGSGVAVLVSPHLTNEELFTAKLLARDVLRTSQIAAPADLAAAEAIGVLDASVGLAASTVTRHQLSQADIIITLNGNPDEQNPVLGFDIRAARKRGARVIAIQSLPSRFTDKVDLWLDLRRGTGATLLDGLNQLLVERSAALFGPAVTGIKEWQARQRPSLAETVAKTGVSEDGVTLLADLVADRSRNVVVVYNLDGDLPGSAEQLAAVTDLLLATGRLGKAGNGLLLTRSGSNAQGVLALNVRPEGLPQAEGATSLADLRTALAIGKVKGLLTLGVDLTADPAWKVVLDGLETLVAVDVVRTETVDRAHVVLPWAPFAECDGSTTAMDRTVRAFAATRPPVSGRTGLEVLGGLFRSSGQEALTTVAAVREKIAAAFSWFGPLVSLNAGQTFVWNDSDAGGDLLFANEFTHTDRKAHLTSFKARPDDALSYRPELGSNLHERVEHTFRHLQERGSA